MPTDNARVESAIGLFKAAMIEPNSPWRTVSDVELRPSTASIGTTTTGSMEPVVMFLQ